MIPKPRLPRRGRFQRDKASPAFSHSDAHGGLSTATRRSGSSGDDRPTYANGLVRDEIPKRRRTRIEFGRNTRTLALKPVGNRYSPPRYPTRHGIKFLYTPISRCMDNVQSRLAWRSVEADNATAGQEVEMSGPKIDRTDGLRLAHWTGHEWPGTVVVRTN